MNKIIRVEILLTIILITNIHAQVKDPIKHYCDRFSLGKGTVLYKFEADIGGDQRREIFISRPELINGMQGGWIWAVYLPSDEGYKGPEVIPSLDKRHFMIDTSKDYPRILDYSCSGGNCCVFAVSRENDHVVQTILERNIGLNEKHDLLDKISQFRCEEHISEIVVEHDLVITDESLRTSFKNATDPENGAETSIYAMNIRHVDLIVKCMENSNSIVVEYLFSNLNLRDNSLKIDVLATALKTDRLWVPDALHKELIQKYISKIAANLLSTSQHTIDLTSETSRKALGSRLESVRINGIPTVRRGRLPLPPENSYTIEQSTPVGHPKR